MFQSTSDQYSQNSLAQRLNYLQSFTSLAENILGRGWGEVDGPDNEI